MKNKKTEIFIQTDEEKKEIALVENEELVEYYLENNKSNRKEGNIYVGIVRNIVEGMEAAFIDIGTGKNGFIHVKDVLPKVDETKEHVDENVDISKILKPKQKILVQVKKDSNSQKGARVSTHINLPSKYIVLMPNTDIVTVSQKIEDKKEQQRLIKLVKENLSEGNGAIIRTLAEGKTDEIIDDIHTVEKEWNDIIDTSIDPELNKAKLLYKSEDLLEKILIDLTVSNIKRIVVSNNEEKKNIEKLLTKRKEYKNIKVEVSNKDDVFETYDLRKQIAKSQKRKIWLNCGGFITIDKTEALTAIDVNTGKFTGIDKDLQKTIMKVNTDATIEIAKQIRLRDIGGIIIIDYIDMKEESDKEKLIHLMKEELKNDRTKTQVEGFTKLDLMELTRKHICSHKE